MNLISCAVIFLAFTIVANAKPVGECDSNEQCNQGEWCRLRKCISKRGLGQAERRSASSDEDEDSSDSDVPVEVNMCNTDPCKNNGTCVEAADNYTCSCKVGFTGRNCEETFLSCPEGWFLSSTRCYLFSTTNATWEDARAICNETGGYLVEINNETENNALGMLASSGQVFWIGLKITSIEANFWAGSGQRVTFYNIQTDVSVNDCILFVTFNPIGIWGAGYCSMSFKYICERDANFI